MNIQLKDQLAKDVSHLDQVLADRKEMNNGYKEPIKVLKDRISKYAEAIKAGCLTPEDFNKWAAKEW